MLNIESELRTIINKVVIDNLRQIRTGSAPDNDRVLFNDYALHWFELQQAVISYSTAQSYRTILNNSVLPYFKGKYIISIVPSDVKRLVSNLSVRLSPKTIRNAVSVVSTIFKSAIQDDIVNFNPCENIKFPKSQKAEPQPFTVEEVKAIMEHVRENLPEISLFFAIGFYAGLRIGEIMGLQWADIDVEKNRIKVCRTVSCGRLKDTTKTYHNRYVSIVSVLKPYIENHIRVDEKWLFTNKSGRPITMYNSFRNVYWIPVLKNLNISVRRPYEMRHTFTVLALRSGEDINWIRQMLGHCDIAMITRVYGNNFAISGQGIKFTSLF